jgi:hypothetical protein
MSATLTSGATGVTPPTSAPARPSVSTTPGGRALSSLPRFDFDALPAAQQRAAGNVAINRDAGEHPQVLARLEELGVIESYDETLGGRPPLVVKRYRMSLPVHIAWCEWCSQQFAGEDEKVGHV